MSIPLHKAAQRFDFGIFLKGNSFVLPEEPVGYAHRDDYYVFGMVDSGSCRVAIDFKEYRLSEGEIIAVQPGQVHRVVDVGDARRSVLFVDGAFVGPRPGGCLPSMPCLRPLFVLPIYSGQNWDSCLR